MQYAVARRGPTGMRKPMRLFRNVFPQSLRAIALAVVVAATGSMAWAQGTAAPEQAPAAQQPPAEPAPLSTPSITGPLQAAPPHTVDAGPLGKISINGVLTGFGVWQSNPVAGDSGGHAALNNGQVWVQKADGWWQFYVQAGAYNVLAVGSPFFSTEKNISELWSPVPVAYLKLVPAKNTSIQIGSLPTLMGAEYTFDFQNMNVERGLLWTQENAINRGVQVNQAMGKFAASLSWNDGYYSNRYSWLSGSLSYTNGPHSLAFQGMGNLSQTAYRTTATPVRGIYREHWVGSGEFSESALWAGERGVVGDGDSGVAEEGVLHARGCVVCAWEFSYGWEWVWGGWDEGGSDARGAGGWVFVLRAPLVVDHSQPGFISIKTTRPLSFSVVSFLA